MSEDELIRLVDVVPHPLMQHPDPHIQQLTRLQNVVEEQQNQIEQLACIIRNQTESLSALSSITKDQNVSLKHLTSLINSLKMEITSLKQKRKIGSYFWRYLFPTDHTVEPKNENSNGKPSPRKGFPK